MKHLLHFSTLLLITFTYAFSPNIDHSTDLQIRNKLSLYALAVDGKQFDLLNQIFTPDVSTDYVGVISIGLLAFSSFLANSVVNKTTQHAISSTVVEPTRGNGTKSFNSTAYVVATFLGRANLTGQSLALYGKYLDEWVEEQGEWKSRRRVLDFFVSGLLWFWFARLRLGLILTAAGFYWKYGN